MAKLQGKATKRLKMVSEKEQSVGIEGQAGSQQEAGDSEHEKMLKNGQEKEDPEDVAAKKLESSDPRDEKQKLLSSDDLEHYKKDPFWRVLRFALFGGFVLLLLGLVTAAIILIALSPKCKKAPIADGIALPQNATMPLAKPPVAFPHQLTVLSGDAATFRCEFPSGTVKWHKLKDGRLEENLPRGTEQQADGFLQIGNAGEDHQGEYVCEGIDPNGNVSRSDPVRLSVRTRDKQENGQEETSTKAPSSPLLRPRVDSYLMIASSGDPVHFRCWQCQFTQCQTGYRLHWRKLHPLEADGRQPQMLVERDNQSAFLIFSSVSQQDSGVFECVDAETGMVSSAVHLQVEPPRTPVLYPMEQTVLEGASARLQCAVPGHSDAQLSWRLENGVEAGRLYGVRDHGQGLLEIVAVRPEHERHGFVCWAVYPKRADKLALHAGPARLHMLRRQEEVKVDEKREDGQIPQDQQTVPTQNAPEAKSPEEVDSTKEQPQQQSQVLQKAEELPQQPFEKNSENSENDGGIEPSNADEGSGEAVIQIEPLLDYIMATGTRVNGTVEESDISGDADALQQQDADDDDKRR